ncbi:MAG: hypothetical protein GWN67_13760 [Phycisphaerae bacterium]|nr:hypothetical protein [Phycisphaerae bacterium]NIV10561.1 hypothetical protein [Fodinibius sp.]NIP53177.1 hypothetical protein [Phycisphaerae bacterium]NIS52211.1 hypothetical protein [Phycisphaerae bacterium]NIU09735.1 hypothetical protein [Phycisphaerae bacterium]
MNARMIFIAVLGISALYGFALGDWTEPAPVIEVNTQYAERTPFLSSDGLSLYFARGNTSGYYYFRIFEATRQEPFGPFTSVNEVLSSVNQHVFAPWVSPDNLRMYYFAQSENPVLWQLKVSERAADNDPWPQGSDISELNLLGKIYKPGLTGDELTIVFTSYDIAGGQGGYDIWMATRPDMNSPFENVTNLSEINTASNDGNPYISPDGLKLYFHSDRNGPAQLFKATRNSLTEPFGNIEHLSFFDTPAGSSVSPSLSSDGTALYFIRALTGQTTDIYVSYTPYLAALTRIENAITEKLDALDKVNAALEKEWTAYDALQELLESGDYGDLSKGDIVTAMQKVYSAIQHQELSKKTLEKSIEKLEDALAALGWQPPPPPPIPLPVAHWTFDEGSGTTAYDSVSTNDGTVYGATWTTGQINKALSFDGVNDYVCAPDDYSLDLGTHDLSFAFWFKTNESSITQMLTKRSTTTGPSNRVWDGYSAALLADGTVNVHFRHSASSDSGVVVTSTASYNDGNWHHLAGIYTRSANLDLYVDGVPEGAQGDISYAENKNIDLTQPLAIGCRIVHGRSNDLYFNGTIDDVAIYNRALSEREIQQLYKNGAAGL